MPAVIIHHDPRDPNYGRMKPLDPRGLPPAVLHMMVAQRRAAICRNSTCVC